MKTKPWAEVARVLVAATPLPLRRLPPQDPEPLLPPGRQVSVPGRGLLFVREAPGPPGALPLVLLHPWSWTADVAFVDVIGPLSQHHPVITVDLRGHGRSAGVSGPLELDVFVDDLLGLLDVLRLERVLLCGHSLGGIVAMAVSLRAPRRVAGLVLAGAAACYTTTRRDRWVWRLLHAAGPLAARDLGRSLPLRYFLTSARTSADVLRRWQWMERELARNSSRAMWHVGQMVACLDLRAEVLARSSDVPAAYVLLTHDTICAPSMQRDMAARLDAEVFSLAADHDVPVTSPARYTQALLAALRHVCG